MLPVPLAAQRARKAGVPEADLKDALDGMKGAGHSAAEAEEVVDAAGKDGPADNFGAFVQEQLAAGKRGKELAAAIHEAKGKGGKPEDKAAEKSEKAAEKSGKGSGKGKDKGKEPGSKDKGGKGGAERPDKGGK